MDATVKLNITTEDGELLEVVVVSYRQIATPLGCDAIIEDIRGALAIVYERQKSKP